MIRFFISPHPTFGNYKKPVKWKVEASPYFWWWYALTLNEDYKKLCERKASGEVVLAETAEQEKQLKVYEDFGDLHYTSCRYAAFASWWTKRVNTLESRGEYLFAEPYIRTAASKLDTVEAAQAAVESENTLVFSVQLNRQRQHVDKAIDRLLQKHMHTVKGRTVRNPKLSSARYSLGTSVVVDALKKTFDVYDARCAAELQGEQITNWQIAQKVKLVVKERKRKDEDRDTAAERRNTTVVVSNLLNRARKLIDGTSKGKFAR